MSRASRKPAAQHDRIDDLATNLEENKAHMPALLPSRGFFSIFSLV